MCKTVALACIIVAAVSSASCNRSDAQAETPAEATIRHRSDALGATQLHVLDLEQKIIYVSRWSDVSTSEKNDLLRDDCLMRKEKVALWQRLLREDGRSGNMVPSEADDICKVVLEALLPP